MKQKNIFDELQDDEARKLDCILELNLMEKQTNKPMNR
jgi:hypothetical protein